MLSSEPLPCTLARSQASNGAKSPLPMAAKRPGFARRANSGLMAAIGKGDFGPLLAWLRANVHGKGSLESTDQVLVEATGDRLGTAAFKAHLETRYLSA